MTFQIFIWSLAVVLLVLYLMKRRARLGKED
jgi:hypothetical protein